VREFVDRFSKENGKLKNAFTVLNSYFFLPGVRLDAPKRSEKVVLSSRWGGVLPIRDSSQSNKWGWIKVVDVALLLCWCYCACVCDGWWWWTLSKLKKKKRVSSSGNGFFLLFRDFHSWVNLLRVFFTFLIWPRSSISTCITDVRVLSVTSPCISCTLIRFLLGRNNLKWTFGSVKRFDSSTSHTDTF
jgi:hypothetical protein